ncbi:hypothetical protein ACJZ2D_011418 [Fusarium nematophilum]
MIKTVFETRGVHHTTQDNGNSTLMNATQPDKSSTPWNIENTYGVTWNGLKFQHMVRSFTNPAWPDHLQTQGLPEIDIDPSESFACIQECLQVPWFDTRAPYHRYTPRRLQVPFIVYKIALRYLRSDDPARPKIRCCFNCGMRNASGPLRPACGCGCLGEWTSSMVHNREWRQLEEREYDWHFDIAIYPDFDDPFQDLEERYEQYDLLWCGGQGGMPDGNGAV